MCYYILKSQFLSLKIKHVQRNFETIQLLAKHADSFQLQYASNEGHVGAEILVSEDGEMVYASSRGLPKGVVITYRSKPQSAQSLGLLTRKRAGLATTFQLRDNFLASRQRSTVQQIGWLRNGILKISRNTKTNIFAATLVIEFQ